MPLTKVLILYLSLKGSSKLARGSLIKYEHN